MREIKFRVWNTEYEEMLYKVDIISWVKGDEFVGHEPVRRYVETIGGHARYENERGSNMKDIILMQFTGLKDKNGKEVYEGDIIGRWPNNRNGACWIVGWDENKSGWAAVYGETDITNLGESMSGLPAFKLSKKLCEKKEIIGDIYSNPELIKN